MMRGLMPWTQMRGMKSEMDRLFDRFADFRGDEPLALGDWAPSMDVAETKDSLICKVEVPGMEQKDLHISLSESLLTITGEKRKECEVTDEHCHRSERSFGTFTRNLRLPVAVEAGKVTATVRNGVLTVTLPKAPAARGTTIPVRAE